MKTYPDIQPRLEANSDTIMGLVWATFLCKMDEKTKVRADMSKAMMILDEFWRSQRQKLQRYMNDLRREHDCTRYPSELAGKLFLKRSMLGIDS